MAFHKAARLATAKGVILVQFLLLQFLYHKHMRLAVPPLFRPYHAPVDWMAVCGLDQT